MNKRILLSQNEIELLNIQQQQSQSPYIFTTNPSIHIQNNYQIFALGCFFVCMCVMGVGWSIITAVYREPLPITQIKQLENIIQTAQSTSQLVTVLHPNDSIIPMSFFSEYRRIWIAPLCQTSLAPFHSTVPPLIEYLRNWGSLQYTDFQPITTITTVSLQIVVEQYIQVSNHTKDHELYVRFYNYCTQTQNELLNNNRHSNNRIITTDEWLQILDLDKLKPFIPLFFSKNKQAFEEKIKYDIPYFIFIHITKSNQYNHQLLISNSLTALSFYSAELIKKNDIPTVVSSNVSQNIAAIIWFIQTIWFSMTPSAVTFATHFIKPEYLFYFFLVSDGKKRVIWDAENAITNGLLKLFIKRLQFLMDIETSSQIVAHGSLQSLTQSKPSFLNYNSNQYQIINATRLTQFQSIAYSWLSPPVLETPSNFPPSVWHLGLWLPSSSSPNYKFLVQSHTELSPKWNAAFSIPRWGVFATVDTNTTIETNDLISPSLKQLQSAAKLWVSHTRQMLGLPAVNLLEYVSQIHNTNMSSTNFCFMSSFINDIHGVTMNISNTPLSRSYFKSLNTIVGHACGIGAASYLEIGLQNRNFEQLYPSNRSESTPQSSSFNLGSGNNNLFGSITPVDLIMEIPTKDGITDWEIRKLARSALWLYVSEGVESLKSLLSVTDQQKDLTIPKELGQTTKMAAKQLLHAVQYTNITLGVAVSLAREGFKLASECLHDPATTSKTFFAISFKTALYIPLVLPALFPLIATLIQELKFFLKKRSEQRLEKEKED